MCNHSFFFHLLLSFSSLFLFLLSFPFVTVILEFFALKKPAFRRLFTQMTADFDRLSFKKSFRYIQLFRTRLREKCARDSVKGNMGYVQYTFPVFFCFPLAIADICPWILLPFFQISLKNSELNATHNTFRGCREHFIRQPFSKWLYALLTKCEVKITR